MHGWLEHKLPEQRLFLKSETETRFIRLKPVTQAVVLSVAAMAMAWTIVATAIVAMDAISGTSGRDQTRRDLATYEMRLDALSQERDLRAAEAAAAQERFAVALAQVSKMQADLLTSEERRKELETGIGVIQATLKSVVQERDAARIELASLTEGSEAARKGPDAEDVTATLAFLTGALDQTAGERDGLAQAALAAADQTREVEYEMALMEERHDEIFSRLEDAVTVSMEPLDKMFTAAGMDPDDLIEQIRGGYSGQGGPLGPLLPPLPEGEDDPAALADQARAEAIMEGLDRMNMYRLAAEQLPLVLPLRTSFRMTSPFGRRWGRMHEGIDMAGSHGSPILATADGVVVEAGREGAYGLMVEIRHSFGVSTVYGHLSDIDVSVGQKVSRGDKIGAMGNTGRSTGTHLHYEVRTNGDAVNPMTYIKAGTNVF